jgi:hypothetical protein
MMMILAIISQGGEYCRIEKRKDKYEKEAAP